MVNPVPLALLLAGVALAADPGPAKTALVARPASERKSVDLTVYNSGQALIREERSINLSKGDNRVQVPDIPATIDATSLHFASLTDAASVRVLEQNYQYDLVSQAKLLEKYLGKTVEFMREDPSTRREAPVAGRILAIGNPDAGGEARPHAGMVAEINGKIELDPAGRLSLPALPEGLILKPQLEWMIHSGREGEQKVTVARNTFTCTGSHHPDRPEGVGRPGGVPRAGLLGSILWPERSSRMLHNGPIFFLSVRCGARTRRTQWSNSDDRIQVPPSIALLCAATGARSPPPARDRKRHRGGGQNAARRR